MSTTNFLTQLKQYRMILTIFTLSGALAAIVLFQFAPKRYKVEAIVSITTQYFQVPMVRDFLPETYDGAELKAQRESLIRRALNHDFLGDLSRTFQLIPDQKDQELSSYDLEALSRKFEIIPIGTSTFLVSFTGSEAEQSFKILQAFIKQVQTAIGNERHLTLVRLHDAIQDRLESLSFGNQSRGATTMLVNRPDLVEQEVEQVDSEIAALKTTYSEKHPKIAALKKRRTELAKWLKPKADLEKSQRDTSKKTKNFSGEKVEKSAQDLFQDLLKKYHYLEVVMALDNESQEAYLKVVQEPFVPEKPASPKLIIFLALGTCFGFFSGLIGLILLETRNPLKNFISGNRTQIKIT